MILNPEAAARLRLGEAGGAGDPGGSSITQIKGIGGGTADRLPAQRCQLAEARLGAATFHPVSAVYHSKR